MPGKILIIDSVPTNRIVLKVKLSSAFYTVSQACNLTEALAAIRQDPPDVILLNAENTADDGGIEQCRTLATIRPGVSIPILMLTCNMTRHLRLSALAAGAEDIIEKPDNDAMLLARIRAVLRAREATDELLLRERTTRVLGFSEPANAPLVSPVKVVFATLDNGTGLRWRTRLKSLVPYVMQQYPPKSAMRSATEIPTPDAFVVAVEPHAPEEGLRLLAEIRAHVKTRHAGILVVLPDHGEAALIGALDLGANAVMTCGFDAEEMALRLASVIKQKRLRDRLDKSLHDGLRAAVTDPLTGLYNRRYALPYLGRMAAMAHNRDFAVMVADLDHFKQVNDHFGHAAGDEVLRQMSLRLRKVLRPVDLLARIGGEEFLIVLPGIGRDNARNMAERLCQVVRQDPVYLKGRDRQIPVTISIGLGMASDLPELDQCQPGAEAAEMLLEFADKALYGAKATGRNQVTQGLPTPNHPAHRH